MSGIAGIFSYGASPRDLQLIRQVVASMQHRGPDKTTLWQDERVALGHCMLRTTPESLLERQPLEHSDPPLVLVLDGRIDNREELRLRLGFKSTLNAMTDAEYVMAAYRRWGEDCPEHLLGEFAFAIWDPCSRRLFCARDQLGSKVIAYHAGDTFFAFASEPDALFDLPGVSDHPNEHYLACLFVTEFENRNDRRSYRKDVAALLEGESMTISEGDQIRIRRYWEPGPLDQRRYRNSSEAQAHFVEVFGYAVRDRLRSSNKVALMLSGGLDSAGVAAMACRLRCAPPADDLVAFSAVDDEPHTSFETHCIQLLGTGMGLKHVQLRVPSMIGPVDVSDLLEAAWARAHPIDNSLLLPSMLALAASRDGHRVMLHGAAGDLAMNTPMYYPAQFIRKGEWLRGWRECNSASRNHYYLKGIPAGKIFQRSLLQGLAPGILNSVLARLRKRSQKSPIAGSLLNPEFSRRIGLEELLADQVHADFRASRKEPELARIRNNLKMIRSGLSAYGRVAARSSIEMRDPWADRRVLDYFFRLPLEYSVRDGWLKYPVRASFPELPEPVRWRRDKEHLGWKLTYRFVQEKEQDIRSCIDENISIIAPYLNIPAVQDINYGRAGLNESDRPQVLFSIITLILWLLQRKPV